ncbi:MAG: L-rhamnose mutarotase [Bacteroidales bacterium]|nr:L-rhamnose mutarotase [Bacteroidales bacterium]
MKRDAFKMKIKKGCAEEYKKRHDEIWLDLIKVHSDAGILDYSIFLDEETNTLFAFRKLTDHNTIAELPKDPVIRKWWDYMKDLMDYNSDGTPWSVPLKEVFHMD